MARRAICLHLDVKKNGVACGKQRFTCKAVGSTGGRLTVVCSSKDMRESALAFVNARFGMPVEEVLEHIEEGKLVLQRGLPYMQAQAYTHVIPTPIFPAALTLPALKKHGDHRILAACNQSMHFFGELGACNNEGRQGSGVHLFARCYFFIFSKWKLLNSASFQPSADIKGS